MDSIITFFHANPWVLFLISACGFVGLFIVYPRHRRAQGMRQAEFISEIGQYLPAEESLIDSAAAHYEKKGQRKEFMDALQRARRAHGPDNLRNGHIYWAGWVVEGKVSDSADIPSFENEEKEQDADQILAFKAFTDRMRILSEEEARTLYNDVVECRKKRESELNKTPLPFDEMLTVYNEVLPKYKLSPITMNEIWPGRW